jgi:hypothetical protein
MILQATLNVFGGKFVGSYLRLVYWLFAIDSHRCFNWGFKYPKCRNCHKTRPQWHLSLCHQHLPTRTRFPQFLHYIIPPIPYHHKGKMHIRSTSSRPPNIISPESPVILTLSLPERDTNPTSCPTSGRFVYCRQSTSREIVIVDFLKYVWWFYI